MDLQQNTSQIPSLQKLGIFAGFKASFAILLALHLLVWLSSYPFLVIFYNNPLVYLIQAGLLFVFLVILSYWFIKLQLKNVTQQLISINTNLPVLRQSIFNGVHITTFLLLFEIVIWSFIFTSTVVYKLPQIFGYLAPVFFISTPFFFIAIYMATKTEVDKWIKGLNQDQ